MTSSVQTSLSIHNLELCVTLGWDETERLHKQGVLLNATLFFTKVPAACLSDVLDETVCYDALIKKIRTHIDTKSYRLIEHLTYDIFHLIESQLKEAGIRMQISLTKYPNIRGLKKGVTFTYSNLTEPTR